MYYCNPINLDYRYQIVNRGDRNRLFREAADPSIIYFKEKYFLFLSMAAGFYTSEDLLAWEFHSYLSEMPIYDYAPDISIIDNQLYFCASKRGEACSFYRTPDPLHEPFEEIPSELEFWDPHLFQDDDQRVYLFWGCSNVDPLYGVELDRATMKPLTEPKVIFDSNDQDIGFDRLGEDHVAPKSKEQLESEREAMKTRLNAMPDIYKQQRGISSPKMIDAMVERLVSNRPYIEGPWLTKHEGVYYLQYAIPGTQYNVYGDGVYQSCSPLGPYKLAKNNPYSYHPGGFMTGAGHGSTVKQDQKMWHISTMRLSKNDDFERRIGLWKAGIDSEGELYCDQHYGDWPICVEKEPFSEPEWLLLSYGKKAYDHTGTILHHVTDEDSQTYDKILSTSTDSWIEVDLGCPMRVNAVQINFGDEGLDVKIPEKANIFKSYMTRYIVEKKGTTNWLLEGSVDGENYVLLSDKREVMTDLPHDFIYWENGMAFRYIRLSHIKVPYDNIPCLTGIRIFGKAEGLLPQTTEVSIERTTDLDLNVKWEKVENALGYNVVWGYAQDKMYHSYQVFNQREQRIGALIKGESLYVRVDTFNESGITYGEPQLVK